MRDDDVISIFSETVVHMDSPPGKTLVPLKALLGDFTPKSQRKGQKDVSNCNAKELRRHSGNFALS